MTTLVFPGQGSQYLGMAKDFYENYTKAKDIFDLIEDTTEIKVKEIIFENKHNLLDITKYTQICIFTASMAIFEVFKDEFNDTSLFDIEYVLGHSLGEYGALTASKCLSIEDCAKLLKIRGELMQNAYPENKSGMAAVIGLNCNSVEKIILENSIDIDVANDNTESQVVISGIIENLKKFEALLIKSGAKKIHYLKVSAAFHSKLMKIAEEKMKDILLKINFNDSLYFVISNFSASSSKDKNIIFNSLSKQMSNKVRWLDSIKLVESSNENKIIEIGPGRVLSGIIRKIFPNIKSYNINKIEDIEILKNEL